MQQPFRVGITRDAVGADGSFAFGDIGLGTLERAGLAWEIMPEHGRELAPNDIASFDGLLLLGAQVSAATLASNDRLAVIARFGVGYDGVAVDACTNHGVVLTIARDGVRRPMATAILTLVLALSQRMVMKDRATRAGNGFERKLEMMGTGLTGRTIGSIGVGNIGHELFRLLQPFEMRHLAHDPYADPTKLPELGVELVDVDTIFTDADFVVVNCPLTPETRGLVNAEKLAMMKPSAFLINAARGPIVDQAALTSVLQAGRIAGAGLDVFDQEPIDPNDPLLALDNVIVTPHALCWTDEWARLTGESASESIIDIARGKQPPHTVNPRVFETPEFQAKQKRIAERIAAT
jgi:D-3-phosphoglycerate dehydrogenase